MITPKNYMYYPLLNTNQQSADDVSKLKVGDTINQDKYSAWALWEKSFVPGGGEQREMAVLRMKNCKNNISTLDLSCLSLQSIPNTIPDGITCLIVDDNKLCSIPDNLIKENFIYFSKEIICGNTIAYGSTAELYEDNNQPWRVLKKYTLPGHTFNEIFQMAKEESKLFNMYYGEDASKVVCDSNYIYLSMLRIPGDPLLHVASNELPDNIEEIYLRLITKMNDVGIIHVDLHEGNILYCKESGELFPIDFKNIYDIYYKSDFDRKSLDDILQGRMDATLEYFNKPDYDFYS